MPKISVVTEDEVDAAISAAIGGVDSDVDALAGRVTTAENTLSAATSLPTGSALVKRDSAGRFRAVDGTAVGDVATKGQLDTAIATRVATSAVGAASGVATLDGTGKVPQSQLPAVALTEFLGAVASQASMLALSGQRGDWATRTDRGTDWQLIAEPSTALASWREMTYPASPVSSVDGRTGAVTLGTTTATASELVRRTSDGRAKAATATESDDLVPFAQQTAAITATGVGSMGRDRGAGTTLPNTDLRRGDAYFHTGWDCLFIYTGSAWRQASVPTFATTAARNTPPTSAIHVGFRIWHSGLGVDQVWDGGAWRFRLIGAGTYSTDANGAASLPHGAGQAPRSLPTTGLGFPQNEAQAAVVKVLTTSSDVSNIYFKFYRTDQSAGFNNPGLYVTWVADF